MKNFWLSWYSANPHVGFELNSPWWISGYRFGPGTTMDDLESEDCAMQDTICAAVQAENEEAAKALIVTAHDAPVALEWRFCEERDSGWVPFSARFPRAAWMKWES